RADPAPALPRQWCAVVVGGTTTAAHHWRLPHGRGLMPRVSQDHMDARRRQILSGARVCFAEYGFEGATVRRLEEATGLGRGAIFHHFDDKDALFLALAHDDAEDMAA